MTCRQHSTPEDLRAYAEETPPGYDVTLCPDELLDVLDENTRLRAFVELMAAEDYRGNPPHWVTEAHRLLRGQA